MKDNQIPGSGAEPRIIFLSPLLHCVSMTALVYLRTSFGFAYLRPKSIFFAFSWAFLLFTIYAVTTGIVWRQHWPVLIFGSGAVLLYWTHLLIAFVREWHQTGEHDHYSGTSHWIWFQRGSGSSPTSQFERKLHLLCEPGAILLFAIILRVIFAERTLSLWLFVTAACLWGKEALNHWFGIRQYKRRKDTFNDAEESIAAPIVSSVVIEPPKPTRKTKSKRARIIRETEAGDEERFAEILRLSPPYTLDRAEANFRELIKSHHPDVDGDSPENNAHATNLTEAIAFFRQQLSVRHTDQR